MVSEYLLTSPLPYCNHYIQIGQEGGLEYQLRNHRWICQYGGVFVVRWPRASYCILSQPFALYQQPSESILVGHD